ncbi:homoserine kinase [Acetonema longum]|uniref:Homoserine kinase n=1 Tax=Acetonema longum DSM 6540 TaxID=1009370 RepID=F7NGB2_9FIRM|nr:homoserine kinase [Acetonema longum]EGO64905.1 homoserine kinase [Acetonema longum DSM 6540]
MNNSVMIQIPGTTANCGPGFDAIGIACTVYNDFELTFHDSSRLVIEVDGEGKETIPTDEKNIAYQAVLDLLRKINHQIPGMTIKMFNRIPLSRGLGSSAAAIVAGLVAANELTGQSLSKQQLLDIATSIEGHPDNVAPAIYGGVTINVCRDGATECLRIIPPKPLLMVVAVPDFILSTKAARQVLPKQVPLQDAVFNVSRSALLTGAFCTGEYRHLSAAMDDRLHQPYRQQLVPGMPEVLRAAFDAGAFGSALSGAGPCLIAFCDQNADHIGQCMVDAFQANGITASCMVLSIDTDGAKRI